jgi:hypothetical protein
MQRRKKARRAAVNSLALPLQVSVVVGQAQVEVEPHGVQPLEQFVVAARAEQPVDDLAALAYAVGVWCCVSFQCACWTPLVKAMGEPYSSA